MAVYKTVQREILLDFLKAHSNESLTVKEIVAGIAEDRSLKTIPSDSTAYRIMKDLEKNGIVTKDMNMVSRECVYRLADHERSGVSMRCKVCGNVYDVDNESGKRIKDELTRCGAEVTDDNIELIVKCRKCR